MNSSTILQSSLLDIIFENRNKDYGAYSLRKFYNNRLSLSLVMMISLVILFFVFQFFYKGNESTLTKPFVFKIDDSRLIEFKNHAKGVSFPIAQINNEKKKINEKGNTPRIVSEKNINKLIASEIHSDASDKLLLGNDSSVEGNNTGFNMATGEEMGKAKTEMGFIPQVEKNTEKLDVLPFSEVMPQFPGGVKALMAYLKKHIHAPGDVEEGKEIYVKIRFVVNYNGHLESFAVTHSGGEIFDNEVLRVLKKMPLWIPGRSKGKDVAVYFSVPVRFTSDF